MEDSKIQSAAGQRKAEVRSEEDESRGGRSKPVNQNCSSCSPHATTMDKGLQRSRRRNTALPTTTILKLPAALLY
ncbi:hypothetical protein J6590_032732 [Homalodisca vitripennis]|nr:hypothetical protein J6590_032732 [Homalodisca vitripennis]